MNLLLKLIAWLIPQNQTEPLPVNMTEPKIEPIPETPQAMVLRVCKEQGLSVDQTNDLYNTIRCESQFKNNAVHKNLVGGKVVSTDFGICQINDYYHIGAGKDFPSVEYVLANPDKVVAWMAKLCKSGQLNLWVCHKAGMYLHGYTKVA